jgi:hypothetical protein
VCDLILRMRVVVMKIFSNCGGTDLYDRGSELFTCRAQCVGNGSPSFCHGGSFRTMRSNDYNRGPIGLQNSSKPQAEAITRITPSARTASTIQHTRPFYYDESKATWTNVQSYNAFIRKLAYIHSVRK